MRRLTVAPGVRFPPHALEDLRSGINLFVELVRPTLGPTPGRVALERATRNGPPEILEDAATILRRTVEIAGTYPNMGAMLLRHTVWQVHRTVGDGSAMTAVFMQSIVNQAARYIAAGGHSVLLRKGIERGLAIALACVREQVTPFRAPVQLERMAASLCHDDELAGVLGEILDTVGSDGFVDIQKGHGRGLSRTYVEGVHWEQGYFSRHFAKESCGGEARLDDPAVLVSDLRLSEAGDLVPLLNLIHDRGHRGLLVIAKEISGTALSLMVATHQEGILKLLGVKAPSYGQHQTGSLEDLAVLTGARIVTRAAGDRARELTVEDLGRARQAWANSSSFGLVGGRGDPADLRVRVARLKADLDAAEVYEDQERIRERLSKLLGGVAILQVGASTQSELDIRRSLAKRTLRTLRLAQRGGVVPGGGVALVRCAQAVENSPDPADEEERVGLDILARALEEPLRVIAMNAGHKPSTAAALVRAAPAGTGFDALRGRMVDMEEAGIVDAAAVLQAAMKAAVSGALMALSAEVLVHPRNPRRTIEP